MKRRIRSKILTHGELKEEGRKLLLAQGYREDQIREEYPIEIANGKK